MREKLRAARKEKSMTQQQMADFLEISTRQYQRIEKGTSSGVYETWDALEDFLGIHQRILRETSNIRPGPKENL